MKLAPLYDHVFYAPDASAGAVLAKKCLRDRAAFEATQHAEQARIRDLHEGRKTAPAPVQTGFEPESYLHTVPADIPLTEVPLEELVPLFDWSMFRAVWGVKENAELTAEGRAVLDRMVRTGGVSVRLAARFFAARRDGDSPPGATATPSTWAPAASRCSGRKKPPAAPSRTSSPRRAPVPSAFSPSACTPFNRPFDRLRDRSCTPPDARAKRAGTTTIR